MSFWTEKWAYEQQPGPSGAKFVLVCAAHFADETGYCYPSQKKLADMTGLKERAVRGHLAALEEAGFITREERRSESGYRTSDGIRLAMTEDELGLPAKSAARGEPTGKKRQSHRQKTTVSPAKSAGLYREEQSVNSKELVVGATPDDTTTRCLQLLLQVKGYPRDQGANALKLAEYRAEFPSVDAVEVCRDFKAWHEEHSQKKPSRLRLRNFFKQAAKPTNALHNGRRDAVPVSGKAGAARREEGYEWLFSK